MSRNLVNLNKLLVLFLIAACLFPHAAFARIDQSHLGTALTPAVDEQARNGQASPERRIPEHSRVSHISKTLKEAEEKSHTTYQPDEELRVIIELEQAPVSEALENQGRRISTSSEKQIAIIQSDIEKQQAKVEKQLDEQNIEFEKRAHFSTVMNGFSGVVAYENIEEIEKLDEVKSVHIVNAYERNRSVSVPQIGAGELKLEGTDLLGDNLIIAVIDDGIDYRFAEFGGNGSSLPISEADLTASGGYTDKVIGGYNWADQNNNVIDTYLGHGTHVAGIAAGRGNPEQPEAGRGVAPNALLLAEKVFSNDPSASYAMSDDVIAAIDHAIANDADVINMSLGKPAGYVDPNHPELQAVQRAVDAGIVVVISAGNFGGALYPDESGWKDYGLIGNPGTWPGAITVAASAPSALTGMQQIADYSSRGPNPDLSFKPDMTAPGTFIMSPRLYEGTSPYVEDTGTSMAAPHVAGAAVLVKQAMLQRGMNKPSVEQIKAALSNTAEILYENNGLPSLPNAQGSGMVRVDRAVRTPVILTGQSGESGIALKEVAGPKLSFDVVASNLTGDSFTYSISDTGLYTEDIIDGQIVVSKLEQAHITNDQPQSSVTLAGHGLVSIQIDITLPANISPERYIGGWITLTANGQPELQIPYFGYLGDWDSIPMFNEPAAFDSSDNALNQQWPTGLYKTYSYEPLGTDYTYQQVDPSYAAFSPLANPGEGILLNYQMLRFAKEQIFQVVNEDDEVLVNYHFKNINKGFRYNSIWAWNNSFAIPWDGTYYDVAAGQKSFVPEGEYRLRLKGASIFGDPSDETAWQTIELPVKIDMTPPSLDFQLSVEEGNIIIDFEGKDEGGSGIWGYDVRLNDAMITYDYLEPDSASYTIEDVPVGMHKVTLQIWDYAGNTYEQSKMLSVQSADLTIMNDDETIIAPNGKVAIDVQTSDSISIVRLMKDYEVLDEEPGGGASRLNGTLPSGYHELVVRAYDEHDNELAASKAVQVQVNAILSSEIDDSALIYEGGEAVITYMLAEDVLSDVSKVSAILYDGMQQLGSAEQSHPVIASPIVVKNITGSSDKIYYDLEAYDSEGNRIGYDWGVLGSLQLERIEVEHIQGSVAAFDTELYKLPLITADNPFQAQLTVTEQVYRVDTSYQLWSASDSEWTVVDSVYSHNRTAAIVIGELGESDEPAYRLRFEGFNAEGNKLNADKVIEIFPVDTGVLAASDEQTEWPVFQGNQQNDVSWTVKPGVEQPAYYEYAVTWDTQGLDFGINEQVRIDDGSIRSLSFEAFPKGEYVRFGTLQLFAFNENGVEIGELLFPIRVDNEKPTFDYWGLPFNAHQILNTNQAMLSAFEIRDMESTVSLRLNGHPADQMIQKKYRSFYNGSGLVLSGMLALEEGRQTISFEMADESGKVTRLDRTVLVDTEAPAIMINGPSTTVVTAAEYNLRGSVFDALTLQEITVNGNAIYNDVPHLNFNRGVTETLNETISLSMGTNIIRVEAFDKAGHHASYDVTVIRHTPSSNGGGNGNGGGSVEAPHTPAPPVVPGKPSAGEAAANGILFNQAFVKVESEEEVSGHSYIRVTLDQKQLEEAFIQMQARSSEQGRTLFIRLEKADKPVRLELPAHLLLKAYGQMKDAKVMIQAGELSYELKLSALNLKKLVEQMQLPVDEIMIFAQFGNVQKEQEERIQALLASSGIDPLMKPVYYELTASAKGVMLHSEQLDRIYQEQILILPFKADRSELTAIKVDTESGKIQFTPALFKPINNNSTMVILKRSGNGVYTVVRAEKELSDIMQHWSKNEIELLTSKLIVQGNQQGRFEPDKAVTRAEFVSMLVRALSLEGPQEPGTFTDVNPDNWFSDDVELAVKLGLVKGFENQTFRPHAPITRQEMAVMAARAWNSVEQSLPQAADIHILNKFSDVDSLSEWSRDAISLLVQQNIMQGMQESRFAPDKSASRAEAAVILARLLQSIQFLDKIE